MLRAKNIFAVSVAFSAVVIASLALTGVRKTPDAEVSSVKPAFNAQNAYDLTKKLAQGYPNRIAWRPERKEAAKFLKSEFRKLGYEPQGMLFEEVIHGKRITDLENIFATLEGTERKDEFIVVLAHYDITDTTIEGAADDASGIGTMLELARVFKNGPAPKRSIVFLATDSEEFGAFWGAHQFSERYEHAREIVAAVSLDFVAPDEQEEIMVLTDGLKGGYTPLWLREMALDSVRSVGFPASDTKNFLEFVQRALLIPPSDHGAMLMRGIPALNLFGKSKDFKAEMGKIHHTPEDNMSHMRLESFVPYGRAAETLVRTVDQMPGKLIEKHDLRESDYWKLSDRFYLDGSTVTWIHFFLFVPFLVYLAILLSVLRRRNARTVWSVVRNELKHFSLVLASLLTAYFCLRAFPDFNLIAKYEMFPATQKSKILYNPDYWVIGLTLLIGFAAYFAMDWIFKSKRDKRFDNPVQLYIRHCASGIFLGIITILAFAKNSYLSTLLVLPPTYLWMYMKNGRQNKSRLLNAFLFLGGFAAFIAVCVVMTSVFHIGVVYWYLFLASAYGLISIYAAILALAVFTVGIRILRNMIL